jgi:energy-converting hydrogenase Eha subunit A
MIRQLKHIGTGLAVFTAVAWSVYDWIMVDQGPAWFAADWRRIVILAVITIVGSIATMAVISLPPAVQQRLIITSFGSGAVLVTAVCGYTVWQFFRMYSFLSETHVLWAFAGLVFGSMILTAFVWFMFLRYLRSRGNLRRTVTVQ